MKIETYVCLSCDASVTRPVVKGQRPKWCADCRRLGARGRVTCKQCSIDFIGSGKQFCSLSCRSQFHAPPPRPRSPRPVTAARAPADRRGALRRGYEDGDADLFFAAVVAGSDTTGECWTWRRLDGSGYAYVTFGERQHALHRLVLEVKHGGTLGSQHAHHMCANRGCVNPDHLQPVTHRDNVAEMMARQSYLARIRELEAALADVAPSHPLLAVIAVA